MTNLTDRDREILSMSWRCFKGGAPEVDYKKLSELGSYKTAASATTAYHGVKKKLLEVDSAKMSDRDRELIVAAWQCFKSVPHVNYEKLKDLAGFKTAASATTAYCNVKKKLLGGATPVKDEN